MALAASRKMRATPGWPAGQMARGARFHRPEAGECEARMMIADGEYDEITESQHSKPMADTIPGPAGDASKRELLRNVANPPQFNKTSMASAARKKLHEMTACFVTCANSTGDANSPSTGYRGGNPDPRQSASNENAGINSVARICFCSWRLGVRANKGSRSQDMADPLENSMIAPRMMTKPPAVVEGGSRVAIERDLVIRRTDVDRVLGIVPG